MKSPKLRSLPLGLILFFLCFSISPCLAQFGGGTGSVASPYLVATAQHLSNVRDYADAYFLQTGDIFLNVEPYNSGQGWLPIGNQTAPFTGSYDGNSFHIYSLYINQPEGKNLGLFGYTNSAVLKNIALNNVNISGKDYIGSLVGSVNGSFIQSCSCDGTITGVSVTGGLVGALELSCHLEKCSADCVVSGQFSIGGLCGYSKGASEIYTSYSKGTVTGNNATGGLVGMQGNSTISQSFSASAVQGNWGAGGLLGVNDTQSLVSNCYSIGVVTGNSNTGGLIGRNVVSQTLSSYWNLESSGQVTSAGGIGRTTDEMTFTYAANTYEDWNLTEIWQPDTEYFVNAGYPYLQWMYPCPPVSHLSYLIENYSVILQWSPPYVSSYTGFNVYKNGELYTAVTDSFFIDTDVYHGEQYTYQVSVVYEGGESSLSEPVSFYVYFPPLPANCVFPLNGSTEMDILPLIQWSPDAHHNYPLPDGYLLEVWALSGTHVVDEDVGNVTSYQITNPLDYETEYYWNVTPYTFGEENTRLYAENVPNWYFTTQEQIVKPVNLTATIENWKNVQLNWNLDEPNWLYWDSGYSYNSIGYIDSPRVWDVTCKFASSDLLSQTGKYITQVKFTPCEASSNYRIRIWSGDDNNIGPSVLLVDQPLQTNDLIMMDWNTVSLLTPVQIQPATAYWIGYNIDQILYPAYPAGVDEGPVVPGKGAIIYQNSTWMELMEANSELNYNFCIRAYVQSGSRELTQLSLLNIPVTPNQGKTTDTGTLSASTNPPQIPSRSLQNFNIYRNGTLIGNSYYPSYYDENLSQGEYSYYVTALYETAESEPSNTAGVTIAYIYPPQNVYAALIDSVLQISWQPSVSGLEQGYALYRLQEGQENEPYLWEQIGYTTGEFNFYDSNWQNLPTGYYKWAIIAHYDYDNYSEPAFSNVIYKVVNLIPDDNFRMAINIALHHPSDYIPTIADLNGLTGTLYAGQRSIVSIEGAQYLTNLQLLDLRYNQIIDLSPLAGLINLHELDINHNQISDLSPLAGLTNMRYLYLHWNQISGLSPLVGLTNLKLLWLYNNQISDLSPLEGLTNLQELWLNDNQIGDLSPLVGLTYLQELWIHNNQISDLSPLEELINLLSLCLTNNQISDLSPLAGLANLQELWLNNNPLSNLSPLEGLTHLQLLHLDDNQISDLSPLAELINLQELYLSDNQISEISPLSGLTNLKKLNLCYNRISDLNPLVGLANLIYLYLYGNQISDLSPLAGLTNLQDLWLFINNPISYESMWLSRSWSLPWSTNEYNPLSPCYPVPNRNAVNVSTNCDLSWQGNYYYSQDVFYEVWLGFSPYNLSYIGSGNHISGTQYSFNVALQPNTQYYWRVKAIAPSDTIWSGMWNFTTGESYYQPIISVTPTSIYDELTTAETSQTEITIANNGTAPLIWNSNIILIRAEQKTGTNAYLTKENNTTRELHPKIENTADNNIRYKDTDRDGISIMPEINLSPSFGTIEPNSSVICILNFIPGDSLGIYNYELQLSSNDPVSPLVTVPAEYVVTSPIAYIPDDNFRMVINGALGQPSDYQPTIADLNGLTGYLDADERNITSIEGAQYLTNLQELYLYYNQISDISPLAGLSNLQRLDFGCNQISDLSPLEGLTNLQFLWLNDNQISNLSPLTGLFNMQVLYLNHNQISDLSPLAWLTTLQYLNLSGNHISDLSPLEGLIYLQQLDLSWNQISDLSPLAGLNNLQALYLWSNQISNLNPLAWLTTLQYLNLSGNHISDLSPLEGLTNLQYLNLNGNQISNLSPLANLTNLYYLYLVYNHISDLSPLAGLTNLQSLYLQQNQISDISPLVELTNLRWLDINYNPISYESMLLSQSWSLPWSTNEYNPLSPCYPVPNRNAVNVSTNYDLSWQGNYYYSQDVSYEVWLGVNPYSLGYQGFVTQMVNVTEHLYSFTPMLEPLTQYYWRIKAIATTDTIWSGMWNFTTGIQEFAGGDGTETNPFQVATAEQLNNVRNHLTSYFIQIANIDLGVSPWNEGEGWVPIGNDSTYFAGNYNGNGYYISNLQINRSTTDYQGLFGFANSAKLINIKINNIAISGCNYVGGLVGKTINCYIADCSNQGIISASSCFAGGIIGLSWNDTTIEKCNYNGTVTGTYCGGITGQATHWCLIIDCYSTGIVSGDNALGGIAGINWGNVQRSFSSVTISASAIAGGIVGISYGNSSINDCFSKGIINGFSDIGGVAGFMDTYTSMSNCYSTSIVTGTNEVGGLIGGSATININNSYWNVDSSGQYASVVGESRTTADMVYPYSDSTYVNWDWDNIWAADLDHNINDGYPYLQWMAPEPLYYPPQHLTATEGNNSVFLSWQLPLTGNPESYSLWCLTPGEEADDSYWNLIATSITGLSYTDYSWFDLPAGSYKWAIKAVYNGENYSLPAFSNELTKVPALPYISIYPTSIYQELTTLDTCSVLINIHNSGNNYLDWNCQIITYRSDQITKTQKVNRDLNISITPSEGILEPGETAICLLEFIPGDTTGVYHYDLQVNSNDITNPVIQIPVDFVVTSTSTIAYIPDDNFRMAINEALGQPNDYQPTIADLQGITGSLDAAYRSISIIVGAQYLTNLQELYLNYNQISDLSPLAGLTNLQGINLGCNMISDLTPLAGLTNLRWLFLFSNYISNIVPLEGLYNLRNLQLHYNQIRDISPLSVLINIGGIALGSNQISDITPLTELTHLIGLELYNNQVDDIKSLSRLVNIQWLYLNGNQISDISPLAGLTNLRELYLSWNQISDISPLAGLYNLWSLDIYGNPISYESMLLSQSWSLPWSTNEYNSLSPCYPDPNRDAVNVSTSCDLSWQGNYDNSQDVSYEVWLGFRSSALSYIGCGTQVSGTQYSFNVAIQPDIKYYWRIKAVSSTEEIWSGMWSFITGEEFYQPIISVTPISIYEELTTAETSQTEITIANNGTAPLIWNSNIVLSRAEQKTGTNAYLTKENNTARELYPKIENTADNNIRYKDMYRDGISIMPEINLSPSFGTIEPNSSVICVLNFIPGDTLCTYNYELQLSSNDPVSPLVTVPAEYVVTNSITFIPDNNFRIAINEALGQPSDYQPTIVDLNGLTGTLYAYRRNISSIEGAQYLINLQELHLYWNQISDLSPLAGLNNLQVLKLGSNQINCLSPLGGLNNLKVLQLYNNQLSDLSPLAGLTHLQQLDLGDNQISNFSPLSGLINLQDLTLANNQISNLSPLEGLTNLLSLGLANNQISDIGPLAGLTNLQELWLYNNRINDLSSLEELTNMRGLYLNYNQINDLRPLAGLTNLQELSLYWNRISDVSPLSGLTHLVYLYLGNNPISYESMWLSRSWSLPWSSNEYNPLSPCYPVPNRNAVNVSTGSDLSWQGNYNDSQDVFYEVWLGISPDSVIYQGFVTQMVNVTEHLYSFAPMLEPLTQYYWRIKAVSSTEEIWSGMWSFTTGNYEAGNMSMLEPISVTVAINALQNQVRLSWQRRRNDESYYVYWSENPYAEFPEGWNGPVNVTETNYTDTLTDKCFYRVFAMPSIRGKTENKQNTKPRAIMPGRGE